MIITSLLDTDLYKFTMMQVVFHRFKEATTKYRFKCRTSGVNLSVIKNQLQEEIKSLSQLRLASEELSYLKSLGHFKDDFLSYLAHFSLSAGDVQLGQDAEGQLTIDIAGSWLETILWEVPLLAVVNELYFIAGIQSGAYPDLPSLLSEGEKRLKEKMNSLKNSGLDLKFAEFGTRRRFSRSWHETLSGELLRSAGQHYVGTSNLALAMRHRVPAIGTMAHEYLQACQALAPSLEDSQTFALRTWSTEYPGRLGVALSDVLGFDAFLADFTPDIAAHYVGTRHDSGDPFEWGEKQIADWTEKGFNPRTKTAVFSDGLNFPLATELYRRFSARIKVLAAIGTNLTNDLGPKPLNNVIKMVELNGRPVAKISDEPGKTMCTDEAYLANLRAVVLEKVARWKAGKKNS